MVRKRSPLSLHGGMSKAAEGVLNIGGGAGLPERCVPLEGQLAGINEDLWHSQDEEPLFIVTATTSASLAFKN